MEQGKKWMKSYPARLMMALCGISQVILLITCILFYMMTIRNMESNYQVWAENRAEEEIRELDYLFEGMRESSYYLEKTPSVNEFLYAKSYEYPAISRTDLVVRNFFASQRYLESVHLYNQYTGKLISAGGTGVDAEQFFGSVMEAPAASGPFSMVYCDSKGGSFGGAGRTVGILFPGDGTRTAMGKSSVIMVLDRDAIERKILENDAGITMLVDQAGVPIFYTQGHGGKNAAEELMGYLQWPMEEPDNQKGDVHTFFRKIRKERMAVTMGQSAATGLYLISVNSTQEIRDSILHKSILLFCCALLAMLFFVVICYILSRRLYSPIGKVVELVEKSPYKAGEEDGVYSLYDSFNSALAHVERLKDQNAAGLQRKKEEAIRKLLNGRGGEEEVWTPGDLLYEVSNVFVICIRVDGWQKFGPEEHLAYEKTLCDQIPEMLHSLAVCEAAGVDEGELALLFCFREREQNSFEELLVGMELIQRRLQENLGLSATIGIGGTANSREECIGYYKRARDMADYRFLYGGGQIFYSHRVEAMVDTSGCYPIEMEQKLMRAVRNHSREEFTEILDEVIALIRGYTYPKVSAILIQLIAECIKTMNYITQNENLKYDLGIAGLSNMFRAEEQIENVRGWMLNLFDEYSQVLTRIHKMKDERHYNMVEWAQQFVRENYQNPDLNVEMIAKNCGYASYYFSRMFKEMVGITLVDYIRTVRIEQAKRLLAGQECKVTEVGQKIGYSNPSNFYATFKKMVGMTPTAYKEFITGK